MSKSRPDSHGGDPVQSENNPISKASWKSLFSFTTSKHLPVLITGSIFALLAGCITPVLAVLLGNIFNTFTSFGAGQLNADTLRSKIITNCLGMVGLGGAGLVLNGAYFMVFVAFGEFQASAIRRRVFNALLKRDIEWFEAHKEGSGAFLSSVQAQVHDLQMATSQPLGLLLQYACRSIASLGLAFYTSWRLSLVTLAGIPIFSAIIAYLSGRMKASITAQLAELTEASKIANNTISSIDTVKCLNGEAHEIGNYSERIQQSAIYYLRQASLNSLQIALIRWMMFGMFVQGFWYGSSLARKGSLSAGDVIRTFWACTTAAQSIEQVLPQMIVMEKGKFASSTLRTIVSEHGRRRILSELRGTKYPSYCEGEIEVRNVSFSYPTQPDRIVLNSSHFSFPSGETRFVIGKSGSGKSTLGQLLMRFYLPNTGQIFIDKYPLCSLDVHWIRNNITLLEQKSVLFNESVLQNIGFGRKSDQSVSMDDIQDAIQTSMLESTIDALPNGLDTSVGPGGSFLSGGQRQRVAIARAKLRDTPILILDEPTSALDHKNRVAIMDTIRKWRKGRTTIIITHDLSHIQPDDFVYIVENGSIVHEGYRHDVEKHPETAKYFPPIVKPQTGKKIPKVKSRTLRKKASRISLASSFGSRVSLVSSRASNTSLASSYTSMMSLRRINKTSLPRRARQSRRVTFLQHHIPPTLRSDTYDISRKRHSVRFECLEQVKKQISTSETLLPPSKNLVMEIPPSPSSALSRESNAGIEMVEIKPYNTEPDTFSLKAPKATVKRRSRSHSDPSGQPPEFSIEPPQKEVTQPETLTRILGTIIPNLCTKDRIILFFGVFFAILHASATPAFSYCLSRLIGTFYIAENSAHMAMVWSLTVLGVSTGDGITSFFMHYFLEYCGEAWKNSLRKEAFKRVLDQPRSWFEKKGNGPNKLASYLDQNSEDMRNLLGRFAGFFITAAAIMVIAIIWSFAVCWKLTFVTLACGPVIYAITRGFELTNGRWERRCNEAGSVAFEIFTEIFSEIRTVRALTLQGYFHRKHCKAAQGCLNIGLKRALYTGAVFGLVESSVILASALIFYYGAILAASEFTVDDVVQVFSLLLFSIGYAAQILSWIPQINTSKEIATHLLRLSRLSAYHTHEHRGKIRPLVLTPIRLMNVNFRYPSRPRTLVLRDVSFIIKQNSCTAIVGRSGSGKSTVASLLLAIYETPGHKTGRPHITLAGQNILDVHVPTLRSHIAVVSQQPTIFPGTIQTNISYGMKPHSRLASLENVRSAAQAAGIDEFIMSLPMGYSTIIGDGGIGLSGGQKQRLVIARALLRQPQILILDEATSSLDPIGAEIVRQTVQQLVATHQDLTVIIITHAKEMIEISDHVIVLDQGVVVEDGTYRALLKKENSRLRELVADPEGGVV